MIEIRNLSKSYGKTEALRDLNLTVRDGSIFGLVGINGSGKSTLLRLASGVFKPDAGEVLVDGENIFENERKKREIFFLPDDPFYSANLTGGKLTEMYKAFYDFDEGVFKRYIDVFGLDVRTPIRNFSKGMRRQLFVSCAFAVKPKYMYLDEVFDGLDPFARQTFCKGLIELNEESGCTAIIASHSLRELENVCDTFGIIDNKSLLESGNISDSLDNTFKFQIAFLNAVSAEDIKLDCLSVDITGRIAKIVVRGDKDEIVRQIEKMQPILVDELPVNFEELFVSEIKHRGMQK